MTTVKLFTRSLVLERDGRCCVVCGASDSLSIHYIRPRAIGGQTRPANLVTLCRPCHDAVEEPVQAIFCTLHHGLKRQSRRFLRWLAPSKQRQRELHQAVVHQSARFLHWAIPRATWFIYGPRLHALRLRRR